MFDVVTFRKGPAMNVGIRELKARLSHYVESARRGEVVIITRQGKPVARLVGEHKKTRLADELAALAAEGVVTLPGIQHRHRHWVPIQTKGRPVSEMVLEDRR